VESGLQDGKMEIKGANLRLTFGQFKKEGKVWRSYDRGGKGFAGREMLPGIPPSKSTRLRPALGVPAEALAKTGGGGVHQTKRL